MSVFALFNERDLSAESHPFAFERQIFRRTPFAHPRGQIIRFTVDQVAVFPCILMLIYYYNFFFFVCIICRDTLETVTNRILIYAIFGSGYTMYIVNTYYTPKMAKV